jgi:hypothetical protein
MATTQLQVGAQTVNDGGLANQRGDNYGCEVVQELNGRYAEVTRRGQKFNFSVAAAAAILLTNTTANGPTIWNPSGSGKILYIDKLELSWVAGTITVSSLVWNITKNAGAVAATGSPILTFTNVLPAPAMAGSGTSSKMFWAPVTSTFTAAPAFYRATGINMIAAGASVPFVATYDGDFAVYPGTAVTLNCAVATTTATFWTTIMGTEVDMPVGTL